MSRPSEMNKSALNRLYLSKRGSSAHGRKPERKALPRPEDTSLCFSSRQASFFREDILKEIGKKVEAIQPGHAFSSHDVKRINDEINELIAEKHRWELRIRALGGRNHLKEEGAPAYRYFGSSKQLAQESASEGASSDAASRADIFAKAWDLSPEALSEAYYGALEMPAEFALTRKENGHEALLVPQSEAAARNGQPPPSHWMVVDQDLPALATADIQAAILESRKAALLKRYDI